MTQPEPRLCRGKEFAAEAQLGQKPGGEDRAGTKLGEIPDDVKPAGEEPAGARNSGRGPTEAKA